MYKHVAEIKSKKLIKKLMKLMIANMICDVLGQHPFVVLHIFLSYLNWYKMILNNLEFYQNTFYKFFRFKNDFFNEILRIFEH